MTEAEPSAAKRVKPSKSASRTDTQPAHGTEQPVRPVSGIAPAQAKGASEPQVAASGQPADAAASQFDPELNSLLADLATVAATRAPQPSGSSKGR